MSESSAPRAPSAYQIERTVSAWQQLRQMYLADPGLVEDEEVIAKALSDAEITHPDILLSRAIDALIWIERREAEADEIRREVIARRDRYRARAEAMRAMIADFMDALEVKSHHAKWGAASVGAGRPSLVVTDEQLVPNQYFKVERMLMKTPLIEALEQGEVIPGAVMSNPAPVLRIRKL
jgi:Siphovirus Gp157